MRNRRVLILDGDMVSALTVARSLWRKGVVVDLAGPIERPLASFSRSVQAYVQYPDPLKEDKSFLNWLVSRLGKTRYDLVIPVTERSLVPISDNRDRLDGISLAIPAAESLATVLDKSQTFSLARALGISIPGSWDISDVGELDSLVSTLSYPVVVKPNRSVGSRNGIRQHLKVSYAFNPMELRSQVFQALEHGEVILQEYVGGDGVGVEVLANHGRIVYAFQHKRLHEVPLTGGASSLRESVPLDMDLLDASEKLIGALNWHGVAMVEFKQDRATGSHNLMEINGRFWGSLPLAVAAGADFPGMLFDMLVEGREQFEKSYRYRIYCRRLTSDVHWYELALRKAAPEALGVLPTKSQMFLDFMKLFSLNHRFDVQSWSDPVPGLIELKELVCSYLSRLNGVLGSRWFVYKQRRAWRTGEVGKRLKQSKSVLFICYGNINRSALAEWYLKSRKSDTALNICSCGFHPESGRPADPVMKRLAENEGIDLSKAFSREVTEEMVDDADVIFVMEQGHYDQLSVGFPGSANKTFLLGAGSENQGQAVIADPYGKGEEDYARCFRQVAQSVDEIINLIGCS